jgi:aromatic ring-opening dioxygenase catalytic subunit (LigB family)
METPPQLPQDMWEGMAAYLKGLADTVGETPRAVLAISGHWDAGRPTLNVAVKPPLLFDYHGFPEHTYRLTYPASGAPELAAQVQELLAQAGFESATEDQRGLDHGVFVPFMLIYPEADVPVLQLSLLSSMDAGEHLALGRALAPLRDQGVLIVGSGMSYHNLRELFSGRGDDQAEAFDAWLDEAVTDADPAVRDQKLADWASAPGAHQSHPEAEHLLPLMVAAGAAGADPGRRTYHERLLGKPISAFQFG